MNYAENFALIDFSKELPRVEKTRLEPKRSDLSFPHVASDSMDPVQSMLDGKMYDSKSTLRATYRQAGMIEVGNDPARLRPRKKPRSNAADVTRSIKKALAKIK